MLKFNAQKLPKLCCDALCPLSTKYFSTIFCFRHCFFHYRTVLKVRGARNALTKNHGGDAAGPDEANRFKSEQDA